MRRSSVTPVTRIRQGLARVVFVFIVASALTGCAALLGLDESVPGGGGSSSSVAPGPNPSDGGCAPCDDPAQCMEAGEQTRCGTDPCLVDPSDAACLVDGLFISALKGEDATADGTRDKPFRTVAAALSNVSAQKRRLYLCEGVYPEDVTLTSAHAGLSLFGGFTCDWRPSATKPTLGASARALTIDGAMGVSLADLTFQAKDAPTPGGSSVAAFVKTSSVTFKRVALIAGNARDGADGTRVDLALSINYDGLGSLDGGAGLAKLITCPGGASTKGGKGGVGGFAGDPGAPGPDNRGTVADGGCGASETVKDGQPGASPSPAPSVTLLGELAAAGWQPQGGTAGANGGPGQGGGGGASLVSGAGGGGGGAGGCGGAGGGGGQGGGASIALAAIDAFVFFIDSALDAKNAGHGGDGASGQLGYPGGSQGLGGNGACNGGNGGNGGNGAAGGGGVGGVSVGALFKGTAPAVDSATAARTRTGLKGNPGLGPANPGREGVAAPTLAITP